MERPIEILLVEDNAADAVLVREALLGRGVPKHITVVTDGAAAVDYLRRRGAFAGAVRPDIVLLDWNLPKRGGREVLREIKCDEDLHAITVIVLTSSDLASDVNDAYDLSANCYVVKPVDLDDYLRVMAGIDEFWMKAAVLPTLNMNPAPPLETTGPV
jgi:CheY-like chemotaxis protein